MARATREKAQELAAAMATEREAIAGAVRRWNKLGERAAKLIDAAWTAASADYDAADDEAEDLAELADQIGEAHLEVDGVELEIDLDPAADAERAVRRFADLIE